MYKAFSKLLIRTPLQSVDQLDKMNISALPAMFEEGIYLSSSTLWNELQKLPQLEKKEKTKIEQAILKYWIRSCSRCTPYGTFAGSTIVTIGEKTELVLKESFFHKKSVRIDTNYINDIINSINSIPEIKKQLKYYPNNSIYSIHDSYRFVNYKLNAGIRSYSLNLVERHEYIDNILNAAKFGVTINELLRLGVDSFNINREEAENFIDEILSAQILLSELEVTITGIDPIETLIEKLECLSESANLIHLLKSVHELCKTFPGGVTQYKLIENSILNIGFNTTPPKDKVQTDMFLSSEKMEIDRRIIENIVSQASELTVFSRKNRNFDLEIFIDKFTKKYDMAEIPLAVALDSDVGVGYGGIDDTTIDNKWINGIHNEVTSQNSAQFDFIQHFTQTKFIDWIKTSSKYITITENEIADFTKKTTIHHFSNSAYLVGSLYSKVKQSFQDGFIFDIKSFDGPSAARLFGRFAAGDKAICEFTREVLEHEEKEFKDAIYAEIVHLPEAKIGNILLRPLLRKYEIPYMGLSGAPANYQIDINDLTLKIRSNEVILKSIKHNKRVLPRLTTAHNFHANSLPLYKFLCDIQYQGLYSPNIWDWGNLSSVKHLPRVVYKDLILKKARWILTEADVSDLPENSLYYIDYFKTFTDKYHLPSVVAYLEGDNELLIDFTNYDLITIFVKYLKTQKQVVVTEVLSSIDNCIVKDTQDRSYSNEVIIPMYKVSLENVPAERTNNTFSIIKRKFPPFSEWHYYKIYCGSKQMKKILKEIICPFIDNGIASNLFDKFFFIRYKDEFSHLRIRFHNTDICKQVYLNEKFCNAINPFIINGFIDKMQIDTYEREIERYDHNLIEESESIFFNDSYAVLSLLKIEQVVHEDCERFMILCSLRGIDKLLDDFNLSLSDKKDLLNKLQIAYFEEFGGGLVLQRQLNAKYRDIQKDIFSYLNPKNDVANNFYDVSFVLKTRSKKNKAVIDKIMNYQVRLISKEEHLFALLSSYIHMFMNRLFPAQQRKFELLSYYFLSKYYSSIEAIEKKR